MVGRYFGNSCGPWLLNIMGNKQGKGGNNDVQRNAVIDRINMDDNDDDARVTKLLLLGAGESGK